MSQPLDSASASRKPGSPGHRTLLLWGTIATIACLLITPQRTEASSTDTEEQFPLVCDQRYALCTSAPCIPDPNDSSRTICACEVRSGQSYGTTTDPEGTCEAFAPYHGPDGVQHIVSTYSFDQTPSQPMMTCAPAEPWSDCLNQPCTVDPLKPLAALCSCKIGSTGSEDWLTLGGQCNAATCSKGYWSGALVSDTVAAAQYLAAAMDLTLVPRNFCAASARELNEAFGTPDVGQEPGAP